MCKNCEISYPIQLKSSDTFPNNFSLTNPRPLQPIVKIMDVCSELTELDKTVKKGHLINIQ